MLRNLAGETRVYPEHLTTVAFDACTLIEISQFEDPVGYIDDVLRHYSLIIPPTALSEFNPDASDRLDRFAHSLASFEGEPLSASELRGVNSKLEQLANVFIPKAKTKERRRYKNQHRNDLQILHQAFKHRAALVSRDADYDRLSNFLHLPGSMLNGVEAHKDLTARVPIFTPEQLLDSYFKDVVFEPTNVRFFNRDELGLSEEPEEVEVLLPSPAEMLLSIRIQTPRDRWEVAKKIVDNPKITMVDYQTEGKLFVKIVSLRRDTVLSEQG